MPSLVYGCFCYQQKNPKIVMWLFCIFSLPLLEYCSPVWMFTASFDHRFITMVVMAKVRYSKVLVECDLAHRCRTITLCMSCKEILSYPNLDLYGSFTRSYYSSEVDLSECLMFNLYFIIPACERSLNSLSCNALLVKA